MAKLRKTLAAVLIVAMALAFFPMPARAGEDLTAYAPCSFREDAEISGNRDGNVMLVSDWKGLFDNLGDSFHDGWTIKLTYDVTAHGAGETYQVHVPRGMKVTLDLAGHTIDRGLCGGEAIADGYVIINYGELTIIDSVGGGKITGGNTAGFGGGIFNDSGATLTLSSGMISGNSASLGGGIYNASGGVLNLFGGTISGNTAAGAGGGIYNAGRMFAGYHPVVSGNTGPVGQINTNIVLPCENGVTVPIGIVYPLQEGTMLDVIVLEDLEPVRAVITYGYQGYGTTVHPSEYFSCDVFTCNGESCGIILQDIGDGSSEVALGRVYRNNLPSGYEESITADKAYAGPGETVTLSCGEEAPGIYTIPDVGMTNSGDTYSYVMPSCDVTVMVKDPVSYVNARGIPMDPITDYTVITSDCFDSDPKMYTGWYVVLSDVEITRRIETSGSVNLILCDGATLTDSRGISVNDGNSLTIWAQSTGDGAGSIIADCRSINSGKHSGIGGYDSSAGTITINGGRITAGGATNSAGIGGGGTNSSGGTVIINGGTVEAFGGAFGAGIGGGSSGSGGTITITGGTVAAKGGTDGAGIGGGQAGIAGAITISGGTVTSEGTAAIGSGKCGGSASYPSGSTVILTGGVITARTCGNTPAIGFDFGVHGSIILGYEDGDDTMRVTVETSSSTGYHPDHYRATKITLRKNFTDLNSGRSFAAAEDYTVHTGQEWSDFNDTVLVPSGVSPAFKTQQVVLSGTIGLNFYMALPAMDGVDYNESYMSFEITGRGTVTERDGFDPDFRNAGGQYYGFTCYLNSIQMADRITATFHYFRNGTELTVTKEYSVADYFEAFDRAVEEDPNVFGERTKALIRAVADYGHYLQPYLAGVRHWSLGTDYARMTKHYTESYLFTDVMEAVEGYAMSRTNGASDIDSVTYSLTFDSDTVINIYLAPVQGAVLEATATVDGAPAEVENLSDGRIRVRITGIRAQDLDAEHTVIVTTSGGTVTVKVCALSYVRSLMNNHEDTETRNAACAVYWYWRHAEDCVSSGN